MLRVMYMRRHQVAVRRASSSASSTAARMTFIAIAGFACTEPKTSAKSASFRTASMEGTASRVFANTAIAPASGSKSRCSEELSKSKPPELQL